MLQTSKSRQSLTEVNHSPGNRADMHDADHAIGNPHCSLSTIELTGQVNML
jgi:hypothetical protein